MHVWVGPWEPELQWVPLSSLPLSPGSVVFPSPSSSVLPSVNGHRFRGPRSGLRFRPLAGTFQNKFWQAWRSARLFRWLGWHIINIYFFFLSSLIFFKNIILKASGRGELWKEERNQETLENGGEGGGQGSFCRVVGLRHVWLWISGVMAASGFLRIPEDTLPSSPFSSLSGSVEVRYAAQGLVGKDQGTPSFLIVQPSRQFKKGGRSQGHGLRAEAGRSFSGLQGVRRSE